ncbi:hypothetical protein Tco_0908370 [Tanacetum coccineum]|uniref:Uncharacterized protein n=1 Tax=Tanacetum coccineum TaxID=301880 RepID=A0ABQ5CLX9_9ASTR
MATPIIAISSDSSEESVGSHVPRVILFGAIPAVIPSTSMIFPETSTTAPVNSSAAPVIGMTVVASPTGLCGLVPYSDSDSDSLDEIDSLEYISLLPAISPFLCADSSEAPDSSDEPPSQDPYVMAVARWRSKVASHPSLASEYPIAPITAPPGIRQRSATLIRPGEAILFGRPYRTHPNGPRRVLTARKSVRPLPSHRLALRYTSHHSSSGSTSDSSSRLSSSSSSSGSSSDASSDSLTDSLSVHSSGFDASDQAHSGSSTRVISPRLVYPLVRAPRRSEAFRHWRAAQLSTFYPPTTSESSSGDSSERPLHSSSHSVPSSTPVMGSLAPTRADFLPHRKRFRGLYSSEASIEDDTEDDTTKTEGSMELGISDGDDVGDHVEDDSRDDREDTEEYEAEASIGDTVVLGIDLMSVPMVEEEIVKPDGEDSSDSSGTRDGTVRSFEDIPIDLDDAIRNFYHHMSEVRVDRVVEIETTQRQLEAGQTIVGGARARMDESIRSLRLENLKVRGLLCVDRDRVDILRLHMSRSWEKFLQIRDDRDDLRRRLRRLESFVERRLGFRP